MTNDELFFLGDHEGQDNLDIISRLSGVPVEKLKALDSSEVEETTTNSDLDKLE